jgi:ribulose-phosphate 3-epimerase
VAVAPSVLAADHSCLREEIAAVENAGADCLHIDVMDGHFVPNITYGPMMVKTLSGITELPLITHIMISDPAKYVGQFAEAGSALVSFHWEALESGHEGIVSALRDLGCGAGLVINPDTSVEAVRHLLGSIDLLLVMTVFPGFGGQSLIPDALENARRAAVLREEEGLRFVIEVDGGIKPANAAQVRQAGGQILVSGTGIFRSSSYADAIRQIRGS